MRYLSEERYTEYELWINIGINLKNIGHELFDVWNKFSKQSDTYESRNECFKEMESFTNNIFKEKTKTIVNGINTNR